jgi:predicted small metal-binding protein
MQLDDEAELMAHITQHVASAHGVASIDSGLVAVIQENIRLVG